MPANHPTPVINTPEHHLGAMSLVILTRAPNDATLRAAARLVDTAATAAWALRPDDLGTLGQQQYRQLLDYAAAPPKSSTWPCTWAATRNRSAPSWITSPGRSPNSSSTTPRRRRRTEPRPTPLQPKERSVTSPIPTWWVIYRELNPAEMQVEAVEPAPTDADAQDARCAEFVAAGQHAYVITAPDADAASDIALRVWAEELVASPARLAAANAHNAANHRTN